MATKTDEKIKRIFADLDHIVLYRSKSKNNHIQIATGTEVMSGDYDYEAYLNTFSEYIKIKQKYKVD